MSLEDCRPKRLAEPPNLVPVVAPTTGSSARNSPVQSALLLFPVCWTSNVRFPKNRRLYRRGSGRNLAGNHQMRLIDNGSTLHPQYTWNLPFCAQITPTRNSNAMHHSPLACSNHKLLLRIFKQNGPLHRGTPCHRKRWLPEVQQTRRETS